MQLTDLQEMSGRRILITGATGLIGSALIKTLMGYNRREKLNLEILELFRSRQRAEEVLGGYRSLGALKFIGGVWSSFLI